MDEAIQTESQPETQEQQPHLSDSLPEDLRNEPSLKNLTDAGSLAKSFVHAQRMIGADKVALPGKSATDEEWRGVYSKIGMPAEASGYEYEADFDEQEHQSFRAAAHAAGLNVKQAQAMASFLDSQEKKHCKASRSKQRLHAWMARKNCARNTALKISQAAQKAQR